MNIHNISFVVQGAVMPGITERCLVEIRRLFPGAEIILSTFQSDIKIPQSEYDKIIINDNLSLRFNSDEPGSKQNNINRQIVSTLTGLQAATRKYAFKIRTDFIITSNNFFKYFDLYQKSDSKYRVFEHKILSCTNFARNPRHDTYQYLFHPSDIAFFGLRDDLINLFDVPLMTNDEEKYYARNGYLYNRYFPEQHLWVNCLNKNGHNVHFNRFETPTNQQQTDTEKYFVSNFIFLSWAQFGLIAPQKFFDKNRIFDYLSCITHCDWLKLYKKYLDSDITVSHDAVHKLLKKYVHRHRVFLFVARLCVIPLFAFPKLRRQTRSKIYGFLYKMSMSKLYKNICRKL